MSTPKSYWRILPEKHGTSLQPVVFSENELLCGRVVIINVFSKGKDKKNLNNKNYETELKLLFQEKHFLRENCTFLTCFTQASCFLIKSP